MTYVTASLCTRANRRPKERCTWDAKCRAKFKTIKVFTSHETRNKVESTHTPTFQKLLSRRGGKRLHQQVQLKLLKTIRYEASKKKAELLWSKRQHSNTSFWNPYILKRGKTWYRNTHLTTHKYNDYLHAMMIHLHSNMQV